MAEAYPAEEAPKEQALRYNSGKPSLSLVPHDAVEAEARVWMFGANKYPSTDRRDDGFEIGNWEKLWGESTVRVCLDSAMRHLYAIQRGEHIDPETGCLHAAHVRCNMAMLIRYFNQGGIGNADD